MGIQELRRNWRTSNPLRTSRSFIHQRRSELMGRGVETPALVQDMAVLASKLTAGTDEPVREITGLRLGLDLVALHSPEGGGEEDHHPGTIVGVREGPVED